MSVAQRKPMTLSEFLAWEERQELRWEFDGFQPVAMTGGSAAQEIIGGTLRALLHARLQGKPCRHWGPTIKIEVMGRIRYPDAFVSCKPISLRKTIIPDPVVVFEILSPGTSRTDRIEKLREYQATPSIQRYVMLEQDSIAALVVERHGLDWRVFPLTADEILAMPEIGIELGLVEIYADVALPDIEDGNGAVSNES
jgi:Uma2 family endonuclease